MVSGGGASRPAINNLGEIICVTIGEYLFLTDISPKVWVGGETATTRHDAATGTRSTQTAITATRIALRLDSVLSSLKSSATVYFT